ncbi:hypothetical protein STRATTON_137 [Erwinia phage vB_EamM_Stratton]|uniref:Uncharacterized protein n=1 Tax=Erwinia phage vB_EamM_Stratton TaxID=1883378 RepID=A0A1B2IH38_9CAUD|nr:hypothetical protein STRATTON_137 [Erwinia phage vB_EamM_Stratton]
MENVYVVIMVLFGFCSGFTFARFLRLRKKRDFTASAGQLLMAIAFAAVFIWAAWQRWM